MGAGRGSPHRRLKQYEELTDEGWALVAAYQTAAYRLVEHYCRRRREYAPAIEDAALDGLCHAALTWREPSGQAFYTWMKRAIFSQASGAVSREKRIRAKARRLYLREARSARRYNGRDLPRTPQPPSRLFTVEEVKALINHLKGERRRLLQMLFVDGLTAAEASIVLKCSTSRTSALFVDALAQLAALVPDVDRDCKMVV